MYIFKNKVLIVVIIALSFDFLLSHFVLKKTNLWIKNLYQGKPWRIASSIYHHDLKPFVNVTEKWGSNKQILITNSLGFRDSEKRVVKKDKENRILLIGDSFIEGLGYNYEFTLSGLLANKYKNNYAVLNSAVSSYSPSIYYFKTKYLIDNGYNFNKALVFLDVSDIVDELYIKFDNDGKIIPPQKIESKKSIKSYVYSLSYYLRDNFITFRFISILSDRTEILKNSIKNRYFASKFYNKNFFSISKKESTIYKMINVDRGNWTSNEKNFKDVKEGILISEKYLSKLFNLLKENNIDSTLIVYPWPRQIYYEDKFHQTYWKNFSSKNNIKFLNLYSYFLNNEKNKVILDYFIHDDVHWNKIGTKKIFNAIVEKNILNLP